MNEGRTGVCGTRSEGKFGRRPVEEADVRTYLVVAHRTLVGEHLLDHARSLASKGEEGDGGCRFHLVVPVRHPNDHSWTEGEVQAAARRRLEEGLAAFRDAGLEVTGEVGDHNPVYAVTTALRNLDHTCDEVVVSTLPRGMSHWLRVDAVRRLRRQLDLPVTHVVAPRRAEKAKKAGKKVDA
jgi:hypothetical protein